MKWKKIIILFIGAALFVSCTRYLCNWPEKMGAVVNVKESLQKQGCEIQADLLLRDVKCFPVKKQYQKKNWVCFDNGYGDPRTYGGKRKHEGIDIMACNNKPGYFTVQSVSDGVVEQKGWLPLGGYRLGIRSRRGMYYYYAHLDSYAYGIKKGARVKAGEALGKMGNTGYGKKGTKGKFAVHLHFGIYYNNRKNEEVSLNPYAILRYIQSNT